MVARDRACDCERQRMPSLRLHSVALSEPSSSGALARCFQRRKVANQNHPRVRGPPVDTTRRIPTRSVRESRAAVTQIGGNRYSDERVYYRIPGISITSRSSTRVSAPTSRVRVVCRLPCSVRVAPHTNRSRESLLATSSTRHFESSSRLP